MALQFDIGQSSLRGPRERNEDYVGVVTPVNEQLSCLSYTSPSPRDS